MVMLGGPGAGKRKDVAEQQRELNEMLERFRREHPEQAERLKRVPSLPYSPLPPGYRAAVTTGNATTPSGLAVLGSSTGRDN
jgi:hypothetical protein